MAFVVDMEDLVELLCAKKYHILRYVKTNFIENFHYMKDTTFKNERQGRGGQNRDSYLLSEECFELVKNSYNLRNRYISSISSNVKCVNIAMCIENSTIGFIVNTLHGIVEMKRQQILGKYRVDLHFPEHKLIVECDENNHNDRNPENEKIREEFLTSLGNTMIRFNPSDNDFDLSNVLKRINRFIFI